jgi:hypothetical protein
MAPSRVVSLFCVSNHARVRQRGPKQKFRRRVVLVLTLLSCFHLLHFASRHRTTSHLNQCFDLKVAVVHEMFPDLKQGGNIRIHRMLEVISKHSCNVNIYVREESSQSHIQYGHQRLKVISDNLYLHKLAKDIEVYSYDVIFTGLWFWRTETSKEGSILPIPVIVTEILGKRFAPPTHHVVISDDIQYVRCFKTAPPEIRDDLCSKVLGLETLIWEDPGVTKVFVSNEDKESIHSISTMRDSDAVVVPYSLQKYSKQPNPISGRFFRRDRGCRLIYMGSAHPANVLALEELFKSAGRQVIEYHYTQTKQRCNLVIAGDSRWRDILSHVDVAALEDHGLFVDIIGFANDLESLITSSTLMMLPVVVGGTGISTKVIKSIELGIPFVSTKEGLRGFPCDEECDKLLFHDSVWSMLLAALRFAHDPARLTFLRHKVWTMSQIIGDDTSLVSLLKAAFTGASREKNKMKRNLAKVEQSCKHCAYAEECNIVCEWHTDMYIDENIALSVFAAIKDGSEELTFLDGYISDVLQQDFQLRWELVLATASNPTFEHLCQTMIFLEDKIPNNLNVKLVHLTLDKGLYETWDYLIESHLRGLLLQNWNIDDRKHKSALRRKYDILAGQPQTSLVSSAVLVSNVPNENWMHAAHDSNTATWFGEFSGYYGLYNLFRKNSKGHVESMNLPHNSPMYRRSLHISYGSFSQAWQKRPLRLDVSPTCSDFRFWTLPLKDWKPFYHVSFPLELYYLRQNSHNRLPENKIKDCVGQVIASTIPKHYTNNLGVHPSMGRRIFFFFGSSKRISLHVDAKDVFEQIANVLYRGYRLHILLDGFEADFAVEDIPSGAFVSTVDKCNNPGVFDLGIFLSGDSYIDFDSYQQKGYFLPHKRTFHIRTIAELESVLVNHL